MDRGTEIRYRTLLMNLPVGVAYQRILLDDADKAVDFVYLEMNDLFASLVGIDRELAIGRRATEVIPKLRESQTDWLALYGQVVKGKEQVITEFHSSYLARTFQVVAFSAEPGHFTTLFTDITHLKEVEEKLKAARMLLEGKLARQDEQLERIRHELELATHKSNAASEEAQLFRTLLDQAGDAVFVLEVPDGTIRDTNLQASAMTRLTRTELCGRTFNHLLDEFFDDERWQRHIAEVREGRRLLEGHLINVSGDRIPVECNSRLVRGIGQDFLVTVVRNITERKLREEEMYSLVQTALDGYILVEANGNISQVNDAYCAAVGRTRAEVLANSLAGLEVDGNRQRLLYHLAAIAERGYDRFQVSHRHASGRTIIFEASVRASGVGRTVRFHFFLHDVTALREAEETIARRDAEIADLKTELQHD